MSIAGNCSIQLHRRDFSIEAAFDIPSRGVLGIFGHSGSGKTTILRCIAGLERDVQGQITVNGKKWMDGKRTISSQARNVGYIFQDSRLFPHLSVEANLEYGARRCRAVNGNAVKKEHLLELLNIGHLLSRKPHQLSGGEKQRVAIGRALLKNPQLMLMDEPLASLDATRKQEILPFLDRLHAELKIPMLYVSHSLGEVSRLCDHILVMEQGRIQFKGSIHDALVSPDSPLAKSENAAAILEGSVIITEKEFGLSTVQTHNGNRIVIQGQLPAGDQVRVRIQASDISLCKTAPVDTSILNIIEGKIAAVIEEHDAYILLQIDSLSDILLARISRKSYHELGLQPGSSVYMQIKAVSIYGIEP